MGGKRSARRTWRRFVFNETQALRDMDSVWQSTPYASQGYTFDWYGERGELVTDLPLKDLRILARPYGVKLPDYVTLTGNPATEEDD